MNISIKRFQLSSHFAFGSGIESRSPKKIVKYLFINMINTLSLFIILSILLINLPVTVICPNPSNVALLIDVRISKLSEWLIGSRSQSQVQVQSRKVGSDPETTTAGTSSDIRVSIGTSLFLRAHKQERIDLPHLSPSSYSSSPLYYYNLPVPSYLMDRRLSQSEGVAVLVSDNIIDHLLQMIAVHGVKESLLIHFPEHIVRVRCHDRHRDGVYIRESSITINNNQNNFNQNNDDPRETETETLNLMGTFEFELCKKSGTRLMHDGQSQWTPLDSRHLIIMYPGMNIVFRFKALFNFNVLQ